MGTCYNQLSSEERLMIGTLLKAGFSARAIAKELSRAPSTISREISRNFSVDHSSAYLGIKADVRARTRKQKAHKRPRLKTEFIRLYVVEKVQLGWSPEQIAGRLRIEHPDYSTNHESIYLYLYNEAPHLLGCLPRKRRRRRRRTFTLKGKKNQLTNTTSIEQRDPAILKRNEVGHWEVDTVYSSKGSAALLVMVERKTRYLKISKLQKRTARNTRFALTRRLRHLTPNMRRTLTFDNGRENAQHKLIDKAIQTKAYFCHPYASYEKGTVENSNGLIRRVFPKGTNFDKVSIAQIRLLEQIINNRPRKCLAFYTPNEVFTRCCT